MKFKIGQSYCHTPTKVVYLCVGFNSQGAAIFEAKNGTVFLGLVSKHWAEKDAGKVWINVYKYDNGTIQSSSYHTYEEALNHAKGPYYIATTTANWESGEKL